MTAAGAAVIRRIVLTSVVGAGLAFVALPTLAFAADPSVGPDASAEAQPSPTATPTAQPAATPQPTPTPTPTPTPNPTPTPTPNPTPAPPSLALRSMNLFVSSQFRYQDPNWRACTAASVRSMLNFISVRATGGDGFVWTPLTGPAVRDRILAWERTHDTMAGGYGSDPHGWRNALNYYGWGPNAVWAGQRVYDDFSYSSFEIAMKATVRALAATGKPVGVLGWRGAHAQMITGYYGLVGNPFAKDATGKYTNAFSVAGFYLTDPLRSSRAVNRTITYKALHATMTYKWRFQRYVETDSRYDDPYTPGYRVSKTEWYGRFVLILPIR